MRRGVRPLLWRSIRRIKSTPVGRRRPEDGAAVVSCWLLRVRTASRGSRSGELAIRNGAGRHQHRMMCCGPNGSAALAFTPLGSPVLKPDLHTRQRFSKFSNRRRLFTD